MDSINRSTYLLALCVATLGGGLMLQGCSDIVGGPRPTNDGPLFSSDPFLLVSGAVAQPPSANVVFIALEQGTAVSGKIAIIRQVGFSDSVFTTVVDGGFDPVAIRAGLADSVEIQVFDATRSVVFESRTPVRSTRAPRVVRISPARKKSDVPVNAVVVVVFSEPINASTITPSSLQVFSGNAAIPGRLGVHSGTGAVVTFTPDAPMASNTVHQVIVTRGVIDLDGAALQEQLTSEFTTGVSMVGQPASIDISPDTLILTGRTTYPFSAMVLDAQGRELPGEEVTWTSSNPNGLPVSANGAITSLAPGLYTVNASASGLTAYAIVQVGPGAVASMTVSPNPASVAAGDTIVMNSVLRDRDGFLIPRSTVTWASSATSVATVTNLRSEPHWIVLTGRGAGSTTITAISLSIPPMTATASVAVSAGGPVSSVVIAPTATTLVPGGGRPMKVVLRDAQGLRVVNRPVAWNSANIDVATVDVNGLVRGVGEGSTTVSAESEGLSAAVNVTVERFSTTHVSAGPGHSCALSTSGRAHCWGQAFNFVDGLEYLGDPVQPLPLAVPDEPRFNVISAKAWTCGITVTGVVQCWGVRNDSFAWYPVSLPSNVVPTSLTIGPPTLDYGSHGCVLDADGGAHCWGANQFGQLGDGSRNTRGIVVRVIGGLTFKEIAAFVRGTCGLTTAGSAYCWGNNAVVPALVGGGLTFETIAGGGNTVCAITATGVAYCWGSGPIGHETLTSSNLPVAVAGDLRFGSISPGQFHSCGVTTAGAAYCWGQNFEGHLGNGSTTPSLVPVPVSGGQTFATLSVAQHSACGLTITGTAYCWGWNTVGQLGDGTTTGSNVPVRVGR